MLEVLKISNLAIVDELEVEFGPGLNVLTGETGAGKSIILKALDLLAGKRSNADIIRAGADKCSVEALFQLTDAIVSELSSVIDDAEELLEDKELSIRRAVDRSGKSRIYLNSRLITASVLKAVSSALFDVTSQHQSQRLLEAPHHRALLDSFGTPPELLRQVAEAYREFSLAQKRLEEFLQASGAKEEYFRRIGFERDELAAAALREGEREEIEDELRRLSSVETLGASAEQCLSLLEEDERGVERMISRLQIVVEQAKSIDPRLAEVSQLIDSSAVQLGEAKILLSDYAASLEADPERLEYLRERLTEIARLERKYNKPVAELLEYQRSIEAELSEYESGAFDEENLRKRVQDLRTVLDGLEQKLSAKRKALAGKLSKQVETELAQLNMRRARFRVDISPGASSLYGADEVEFMLAANPGEPHRALGKVASGGELSRVLLILKTLLNEQSAPLLQVFDEVDSGVGGAVAQIVGEKLAEIAAASQVLLVTHAPQVAAHADNHYLVIKESTAKSTRTSVCELSQDERVAEVARMLAGKKITANFEDSARELLAQKLNHESKKPAVARA